jgi:hypothetical protein
VFEFPNEPPLLLTRKDCTRITEALAQIFQLSAEHIKDSHVGTHPHEPSPDLPEFERTSGTKVTTGSGSSQGAGPQTIGAQLARGVPANVVILSREGLNEMIAANRIVAGTDVDFARAPLGVATFDAAPVTDGLNISLE